jgi:hypothetical protein
MPTQKGLFDDETPSTPAAKPSLPQRANDRLAELRARHPGMLLLFRLSSESYRWLEEDHAAVQLLGVPLSFSWRELEYVLRKFRPPDICSSRDERFLALDCQVDT